MKLIKKGLFAGLLSLCFVSSGCLGPNRAFNSLHEWNEGVSENEWANEAVFLGMTIIPVYSLAYLADIVVFNTIEFWGGDNPIDD